MIERPEVLIVGSRPVIMHAYDLAKTPFNKMFGLGNVKHNTNVRAERYNRRKTEKINAVVELWGIWRKYKKPAPRRSVFTDKNINMAKRFLNKENAKMIKVVKKILEKINLIGIAMMITAQAALQTVYHLQS